MPHSTSCTQSKDSAGAVKTPVGDELAWLNAIKFGSLDEAEIGPFLDQAGFLIDQMYVITRTPPKHGSANISGEALKQLEAGLLGKIRRAHVSFGNAWENVAALAHRVERAFGREVPPTATRWTTKWKPGAIRDDAAVVAAALSVADRVGVRTFLAMIAPVWDRDAGKIEAVLESLTPGPSPSGRGE